MVSVKMVYGGTKWSGLAVFKAFLANFLEKKCPYGFAGIPWRLY
jgi:hypothetical protein